MKCKADMLPIYIKYNYLQRNDMLSRNASKKHSAFLLTSNIRKTSNESEGERDCVRWLVV